MSPQQLVLVIALAMLLLPLTIRGVVWSRIRSRRLRLPTLRVVAPDELPESLAPVFRAAEALLIPAGFRLIGARRIEPVDASEGPRPERVYEHAESGSLAFVGPPLPGMGERPYRTTFISRLRDGAVIGTFDGLSHLTPGFPLAWTCFDHEVNDLGRQWALHLSALSDRGGSEATLPLDLEAWTRVEEADLRDMVREWERSGRTRRVDPGEPEAGGPCWRLGAREAWSLATRSLRGQRRLLGDEAERARAEARRQLWRRSLEPVATPSEPDLDGARASGMAWGYRYERESELRRRALGSSHGAWWGLLAALAGLPLLFGWPIGWGLAGILMGVLCLHELGHRAAMEVFSYRDRRVFFLPLLGATVADETKETTPTRRALVHLLGPVPGLLLGLAALTGFFRNGDPWWLAAAITALAVNYMNLLPLAPLDGGRIVESLVLDRFPRAQAVFLGAGALAFTVGAWRLRDPILAGVALALVIALRTAWSAAGAIVRTRDRIDPGASAEDRVRTLCQVLAEPPYASSPAARRMRVARAAIPRLSRRPTSLRTALAGSAVYLVLLIGVPVGVVGSAAALGPASGVALESAPASSARLERAGVERRKGARPEESGPGRTETSAAQARRSSISEISLVGR